MNKRVASLMIFVMFTALCGFGSVKAHPKAAHTKAAHRITAQNQFHFAATKGRGKLIADKVKIDYERRALLRQKMNGGQAGTPLHMGQRSPSPMVRTKLQRHGIAPAPTIGFVSATQLPSGGGLEYSSVAMTGDFNGDGLPDLITLTEVDNDGTFTPSFSVSLSNGDGTFSAPALTATAGGSSDPFVIGDVDGDGVDDLVMAHQPQGGCGGVCATQHPGIPLNDSTIDVYLGNSSNGDGTFTYSGTFAVSDVSLSGGLLADVDGDGNLDVVLVDSASPGDVWTMTGNGDGTFNVATSVALSAQVGYDVVIADLNGDGLLDVIANDNSGVETVFLAASATTYADAASYPTSDTVENACDTTVGDVTGDGFPEIVSANCNASTITIYVNNGDGTFATGAYYAAANTGSGIPVVYPDGVTVADVNGDGIGDVISSNDDGGDVTILLGNGDGSVTSASVGFAVGGYPVHAAVVADFNGDGLLDIAVDDDLYSIAYMKGYGDGTFRAGMDFYVTPSNGSNPYSIDVATGDFNGDSLPDVVLGNCCDSGLGVTVFLSRPDGSMQPGVNYGSGGGMEYVTVGDFDGDGKLDIAATDYIANVVQVFHGAGDGTFTVASTYSTGGSDPQGIVVADFDQDGFPDLAVANSNSSNVGILMNDGTGAFAAPVTYATCTNAFLLTAADINGDGYPDIVVPLQNCAGVAVLLNDTHGVFNTGVDFGIGNAPWQIAAGDLNGDGNVDLAVTVDDYTNGHAIAVVLGNGDGTFGSPITYPSTLQDTLWISPYPTGIKLADINGDGILDAVYTNAEYGTVGLMYGIGDGQFYPPKEFPTISYTLALAVGDVNGDGAPDVVTAGEDVGGVGVLLNDGGSGVAPNYTIAADTNTQTVAAGSSATFTITVTPHNFYNGTISFSCGTLPAETTCTFNPTTLTPNGNGAMTTTLTIHTTAASASLQAPAGIHPNQSAPTFWASLSGVGIFGLLLLGDFKKKRNRRVAILLGLVVLGMMVMMMGCGGSSSTGGGGDPGTPKGAHQITISATGTAGSNGGNTAAHNLDLNVTVQ